MLKDCLQFTSVKVHDFSSTVSKYEELFFLLLLWQRKKRNNFHKKLLNKRRLQYLLYNIILL